MNMTKPLLLTFVFFGIVSLCSVPKAGAQEVEASRPPEKGCVWTKLRSEAPKFSVIVQQCDFGFRKITHSIEGNAVVEKFSDAPATAPGDKIIEIFALTKTEKVGKKGKKEIADPPETVLKKKFVDQLKPYEKLHCYARPTKSKDLLQAPFLDKEKTAWIIMPDKEYRAKIDRETPEGDMPENSCGAYGVPVDSRSYFEFHPGSKESFAWVVIGQDTPLFDEQSLEF